MAFLGVFWYSFKNFISKKYSKCKQTKYLGFVKLGVRWAERDIGLSLHGLIFMTIKEEPNRNSTAFLSVDIQI